MQAGWHVVSINDAAPRVRGKHLNTFDAMSPAVAPQVHRARLGASAGIIGIADLALACRNHGEFPEG